MRFKFVRGGGRVGTIARVMWVTKTPGGRATGDAVR